MQYREIGKTGLKSSVIGMGCEHLDGKPARDVDAAINHAIDCGINYFDVFMPGEDIRKKIGKALGSRRKEVMLQGHICSTDINEQYDISRDLDTVKKYFDRLLEYLNTDYIDFGMLFFIDNDKAVADIETGGIIDYALELKKQGVIRHIGASSHNASVAAKLVDTGLPDVLMFAVNPAYDLTAAVDDILEIEKYDFENAVDPARQRLYRLCEQKGVGITVMKSLGAGKLISPEFTPFDKPLTVPQCINYALDRPAVCSVLAGFSSPAEIDEGMRFLEVSEEEKDYSAAISKARGNMKGACVYCGHCRPCPAGIDVAQVNKYLDIARLDENHIPPSIKQHYRDMESGECIECGSCESRCPFDVSIIENIKEARRLLGE